MLTTYSHPRVHLSLAVSPINLQEFQICHEQTSLRSL